MVLVWVLVLAAPCVASAEDTDVMYQSILDSLSKTQIHGFLSQGFLWSSDNDYLCAETSKGDFRFNELGINFGFDLADKLRVGLQLFSRSFGSFGNNEIELDWAFADYRFRDWLGFRAGKIKSPLGLYNETRDIDALRANILMPESVYSQFDRGITIGLIGFGIYGHLSTPGESSLSYQLQLGTQNLGNRESSLKQTIENYGITPKDGSTDYVMAGSLVWNTPLDWLRVSGTVMWWENLRLNAEISDSGPLGLPAGLSMLINAEDYIIWVASLEAAVDQITFVTEFKQTTSDTSFNLITGLPLSIPYDLQHQGFYASLSYLLTDSLEMGIYYSMYWPDASNRYGTGSTSGALVNQLRSRGRPAHEAWQQDLALSVRHDIFEGWSVKLEGHYMNGTALCAGNGTNAEDWFLGAVKTSYAF